MILIDRDAELARDGALVDRLWDSSDPADIVRLEPQARLIAAHKVRKWPRRPAVGTADLIRHLMDQHRLTRADMVPPALPGASPDWPRIICHQNGDMI